VLAANFTKRTAGAQLTSRVGGAYLAGRHAQPARYTAEKPSPTRPLACASGRVHWRLTPTLFDEMVDDGRMPKPARINTRAVWDRMKLDEAFAALSDGTADDPWSKAAL
jgi:hypothetical protein